MLVSCFKTAKTVIPIKDCLIDDIFSIIKSEVIKKKGYKSKLDLPCFTPSGTFITRKSSEIKQHSGLICLDIDKDCSKLEQIKDDHYTLCVHKSFSQNGLAVYVKIPSNINTHLFSFLSLERYYKEKYDINIDKSCKDISRLRFLSYDAGLYFCQDAKEYKELYTPTPTVTYKKSNNTTNSDILSKAVNKFLDAMPGHRHFTLLKQASLVGGYISGGEIEESVALYKFNQAINQKTTDKKQQRDFKKALVDAINYGKLSPLTKK